MCFDPQIIVRGFSFLRIETYVRVYIYKSYNKGGFYSASVGVKLISEDAR
jgi:hypothetical protein